MASTTFINYQTVIDASWLNDVNNLTYNGVFQATAVAAPPAWGTVTPNTGAFTTLSASSTVSGTGFSTYLASPPAIGGTAPSTGKFTSVTDTGLTSGRVTYAGTSGILQDSANMTFDGTALTLGGNPTLSGGTANGVLYLNGSKVATSGTGLVFDGTNLGVGGTPSTKIHAIGTGSQEVRVTTNTSGDIRFGFDLSGAYYNWIDSYRASGAIAFATANTERMRIDSSGNLLVGTTSSPEKLCVVTSGSNNVARFQVGINGNGIIMSNASGTTVGSITINSSSTNYNTSSDYRLKDITGTLTGYKERIMALQPKQGSWKADGSEFRGFLAHEFATQYPASVSGEKDAVDEEGNPKYQGMQAGGSETIADLVALAQEQQAIIQSLTARLEALEAK